MFADIGWNCDDVLWAEAAMELEEEVEGVSFWAALERSNCSFFSTADKMISSVVRAIRQEWKLRLTTKLALCDSIL